MDTISLLERALEAATRLGYCVRREWLGGSGGGACELKGQKFLFIDLAQGPADHLEQVLEALRGEPKATGLKMCADLRKRVGLRSAG